MRLGVSPFQDRGITFRSMILSRSDRRGRVTPRTYFLSDSLFRGRVLSAFSSCVLPGSPALPIRVLVVILILDLSPPPSSRHRLLSSLISPSLPQLLQPSPLSPLSVASSYSRRSHRTAYVPRNRTAFSSGICGLAHNEALPLPPSPSYFPADRRSSIADSDRKAGEDVVFISERASLLSRIARKNAAISDFQPPSEKLAAIEKRIRKIHFMSHRGSKKS